MMCRNRLKNKVNLTIFPIEIATRKPGLAKSIPVAPHLPKCYDEPEIRHSSIEIESSLDNPSSSELPTIGWREWVRLPELLSRRIKAKVDTGARSSSLHASEIEPFEKDGETFVRFKIHPNHGRPKKSVDGEAKVIEFREVKSSSGATSMRPVIQTKIILLGETWPLEVTLADRDAMGFRMLLGREAIRGRFLVHAGQSYFGGKPRRKKRKRKRDSSGNPRIKKGSGDSTAL